MATEYNCLKRNKLLAISVNESAHEILVLTALPNNEGSCEPVHMYWLARAFAANIGLLKVLLYMKANAKL